MTTTATTTLFVTLDSRRNWLALPSLSLWASWATDAGDDQVRDAMISQPKGVRFAEVLKTAIAESFVDVQPEDFQLFDSRQRLINIVPEIRTAMLDLVAGAAAGFEDVTAQRNLEERPEPKRLSAILDLWAVLGARGNKP